MSNINPNKWQRPLALQRLIDAARGAIMQSQIADDARQAANDIFAALDDYTGVSESAERQLLAVCQHLSLAIDHARDGPPGVAALADSFADLRPSLSWRRRAGSAQVGPEFHDGHANSWIIGPDGLERRNDVIVGASLVAPAIRYPDHSHPPAEFYVVMSEGKWFTKGGGWESPGIGGIVYNPPGVVHAMRSGPMPLFALWCLWVGGEP